MTGCATATERHKPMMSAATMPREARREEGMTFFPTGRRRRSGTPSVLEGRSGRAGQVLAGPLRERSKKSLWAVFSSSSSYIPSRTNHSRPCSSLSAPCPPGPTAPPPSPRSVARGCRASPGRSLTTCCRRPGTWRPAPPRAASAKKSSRPIRSAAVLKSRRRGQSARCTRRTGTAVPASRRRARGNRALEASCDVTLQFLAQIGLARERPVRHPLDIAG